MSAQPSATEPEGHYDAIVVGSGFGGAVMAYRLAEAGMSVCLLERGKPYPPGSFPRSPWEMGRNFWDPSAGLHGLLDVWSFRGLGGIVASGLGGGSLLWSNVVLRKDPSTFVREDSEYWPVTYEELVPHYERHERMLKATPYPFDRPPYDRTYKTKAMQHASGELGLEWFLPPLAVAFDPGDGVPRPGQPILGEENLHGRPRLTCLLCGECNVGCNYGAKNTLDYNYLSLAKLRHGAELRTRCEVKAFAPRAGGGYTVDFVDHSEAAEGEPRAAPLRARRLTADRLVLSAGSFGSTYLLLKNRAAFPGLSERLGTHFCGNGDLLTIALKARENGGPRIVDPGYGPVITSTIRVKDAAEGGPGRGFYLQDGGHPQHVNWIVEASYQLNVFRKALRLGRRLARLWLRFDRRSDIGREIAGFFAPAELSSTSMPLFSMGRDMPDGNMTLTDDGYLDVDWDKRSSTPFFEDLRRTARAVAGTLDAKFMDNPSWYLSRVVTVHPLGGCPMGRDEREGVVDSYGRVFGHPGLVIADGSILPGPVGPNPSTTIAAVAHRAAERLVADAR
ncbi:MAG TPA: GMC family oxidoreductase [Gaiellaceae bacterium]|nr:GMC family oxidoreductase [Gaiellaceae bacterium]